MQSLLFRGIVVAVFARCAKLQYRATASRLRMMERVGEMGMVFGKGQSSNTPNFVYALLCVGKLTRNIIRHLQGVGPAPWAGPDIDALGQIRAQSIGYAIANGRVKTLLSIISVLLDDKVDIAKAHPPLHKSCCVIYCQHIYHQDARSELFANFQAAYRASMKKPPSLMTWVKTLKALKGLGDRDAGEIIKSWNKKSTDGQMIRGAKAQALKRLLEDMPEEAQEEIDGYVGFFTWELSPWSEEALNSPKHYPGYKARSLGNKAWESRLVVTPASCVLWIRMAANHHLHLPIPLRRKLTKQQLEDYSMRCIGVTVTILLDFLTDSMFECVILFLSSDIKCKHSDLTHTHTREHTHMHMHVGRHTEIHTHVHIYSYFKGRCFSHRIDSGQIACLV